MVVSEATTITLTITDSNGAEANTTVRLVPRRFVQNLQAVHDGRGQVTTWTWTGDVASFNVSATVNGWRRPTK